MAQHQWPQWPWPFPETIENRLKSRESVPCSSCEPCDPVGLGDDDRASAASDVNGHDAAENGVQSGAAEVTIDDVVSEPTPAHDDEIDGGRRRHSRRRRLPDWATRRLLDGIQDIAVGAGGGLTKL